MKNHLEFRSVLLAETPYAVLEHAHWSPQAAGLSERHRPNATADRPDEKRFARLRRLWRTKEIWLTHSLECVLAACGPAVIRAVFGLGGSADDRFGLYSADWAGPSRHIGVPDLIAISGEKLLLVEVKSGATPSNHRYSLAQYEKYMKFAAVAMCSNALVDEQGQSIRIAEVEHVLLAPSGRVSVCIVDCEAWKPHLDRDGQLTIGDAAVELRVASSVDHFLVSNADRYALDRARYPGMSSVRTTLVDWRRFTEDLADEVARSGRTDLVADVNRLYLLSTGKAPIRPVA